MEKKKNGKSIKKINKKFFLVMFCIIIIILIVVLSISRSETEEQNNTSKGLTVFDTNLAEYVKETEDGIKINVSPKLNQDKKIGELSVTDIQLTYSGGITTLICNVTNNTTNNTNLQNIEAVLLDENGNELYVAKGIVSALQVGENTKLNIAISSNYITAYDVEFRNK